MSTLTLRDLFAIVTIVALALGWWVDHRRLKDEYQELEIRRLMLEQELLLREVMEDRPFKWTHEWSYRITPEGDLEEIPTPREQTTPQK